jgi:tetratricopeptide (TPR) repeat protein
MLLARTHLVLGESAVAVDLLERAVRDREELSAGAGGAAIEALNLGRACLERGRYADALHWLEAVRVRMSGAGGGVVKAAAESALARTWLQLGQPARAQKVLDPLPAQAPFDQQAGRLWVRAQLAPRAALARPLYDEALLLFGAGRDLPFVRVPIEVDRAAVLAPVDGVAACDRALAECEARSLLGTRLHAGARRAQLLLATGDAQSAATAMRTCLAELTRRQPFYFYLPELWWIAAQAFTAVGDEAAARSAIGQGVDWIGRIALPQVPAEFRDSFLARNPINRLLLTSSTRHAAVSLLHAGDGVDRTAPAD